MGNLKWVFVAIALAACASQDPDDEVAPAPLAPPAMTRPPSVPAHYEATPNGWFDPACIIAVAPDEHVSPEGHVVAANGSIRLAARPCPYPRYDRGGKVVPLPSAGQPTPPPDGYYAYGVTNVPGGINLVSSQWTVPALPSPNSGQLIYFFPGLENNLTKANILQPVLGYNHSGGPSGVWSLASWDCCVGNVTHHSTPYLTVAAGSTVSGTITGTGCNLSTGVCATWQIISRDASNATTVLITSATQVMDLVFGHAMEAHQLSSCLQYPATNHDDATQVFVRNVQNVFMTPVWQAATTPLSPQCSYAVTSSTNALSLSWVRGNPPVCVPGDHLACCGAPAGQVCRCRGTKTCNAQGTGYGTCVGWSTDPTEC